MSPRRLVGLLQASVAAAALLTGAAASGAPGLGELAPARPVVPDRSFRLRDFGAVGDGTTSNTDAFKQAVAAVAAAGGGTLLVPAGTYCTGPFDLCSGLNLHLAAGATILFSPRPADYRGDGPKGYRPLLRIRNAHDVMISGAGTINGHGEAWWPEALRFRAAANAANAASNTSPRPVMVAFAGCQRIRLEGITLTQAPVFDVTQTDCQDVTVEGITIYNPAGSPNTDGVDPKSCQRVLIAHCHIDTGDDEVALGGGGDVPEEDILITDCTFGHGHGCSIGSGTACGVRNVLVRRCTFDGTDDGMRLKSARGKGGLVENVTYEDLTMKNVGTALSLSSSYGNSAIHHPLDDSALDQDTPHSVTPTTPRWKNITIRNVTATACRDRAGLIAGLREMPLENVRLENVTLEAPVGLRLANARGVTLQNVHITAATGPDLIVDGSVQGLTRHD